MRNYFIFLLITHKKIKLKEFFIEPTKGKLKKKLFPLLKYSNSAKNDTQCVRSKEKLFHTLSIQNRSSQQIIMKYLGLASIILICIDIL